MSDTQRGRCGRRITAALMASLMAANPGCSAYRTLPLTRYEIPREVQPVPGAVRPRIRFRVQGSDTWGMMQVHRIDGPWLFGVVTTDQPPRPTQTPAAVDVRRVTALQLYSDEAATWSRVGAWTGGVLGVAGGIYLILALIAVATKTSCPFVFVETPEGVRFAGEAYSGSIVRPLQRDDLLALPALGAGDVRITLSNHAFETQYTDRFELWLVDHPTDTRAVAGVDARPWLVGPAQPPTRAAHLSGAALDPPANGPDLAWSSDMPSMIARPDAPLRDGIELTFAPLPPDATPVLELDAANTHWLDLVLGRMFASFGDGLRDHLARADAQRDGAAQRAWREREGVDLSVEALDRGAWRRVSLVPTPGPAAPRRIAVELPRPPAGEPVRVRLTAGTGFWRIDAAWLSALRDREPAVTRIAPSRAIQPDGTDARGLLARTDGAYQILAERGERLTLSFETPQADGARARTAFVFANGYYSVHAQPQAERSVATLRRLRDEPGALARFGLDLYREFSRVVREAPVAP